MQVSTAIPGVHMTQLTDTAVTDMAVTDMTVTDMRATAEEGEQWPDFSPASLISNLSWLVQLCNTVS